MEKRNTILFISIIGAFLSPFVISSINIALPLISDELSISSSTLSWITSSTVLSIAVFILPAGKLSDMMGRRKTMFFGTVILTISSLLCGLSNSLYSLLLFRVLQGIGSAFISTSVVAIVSSVYPPEERGKALGINVACTYIGLSAGPIIGGFIITYNSWRSIFFFPVLIGLCLALLLYRILKDDEKHSKDYDFDLKGSLLYGISVFMIIFGFSNMLLYSWSKYVLISGFVSVGLFTHVEVKSTNPILDVKTFKDNRILIFSSIASLINYSSTYAISYLMSIYLQVVLKLNPDFAGTVLLTQTAVQALLSPLMGHLSDKIESRKLASIGMAIISTGLIAFSFFTFSTSVIIVVLLLGIVGVGYALFSSPNTNAVMTSVDKKYYGVASGILGTARTVGQSFSMSLTTLISSVYLGNLPISIETVPQFLNSFRTTFIIMAVLCFLGVFASLARGKSLATNENS